MLPRLLSNKKNIALLFAALFLTISSAFILNSFLSDKRGPQTVINEAETVIIPAEGPEQINGIKPAISVSPAAVEIDLKASPERQFPLQVSSTWKRAVQVSVKFLPQSANDNEALTFSTSTWRARPRIARTIQVNINSEKKITGNIEVSAQLPKRRTAGVDVQPNLAFRVPVTIKPATADEQWFLGSPTLRRGRAVVVVENRGSSELIADGWARIKQGQDIRELPLDARKALPPGQTGEFRALQAWKDLPAGEYTLEVFVRSAQREQSTQRRIEVGEKELADPRAASFVVLDSGRAGNGWLARSKPARVAIYNTGTEPLSGAQLEFPGSQRIVPVIPPGGQALIEVNNPQAILSLKLKSQGKLLAQGNVFVPKAPDRDWILVLPIILLVLAASAFGLVKRRRRRTGGRAARPLPSATFERNRRQGSAAASRQRRGPRPGTARRPIMTAAKRRRRTAPRPRRRP